jgi:hypothetical protein
MNNTEFYEEQSFTQPWVQLLLYLLWACFILVTILMVEKKAMGLLPSLLLLLFVSVFIIAFKSLKLITRITHDAIRYRFYPFQPQFRIIRKQDIAALGLTTYDAISDYGGWGIRFGKKGTAYTVRGRSGLLITLASGKNILIGTSKLQELESFLTAHGHRLTRPPQP